MSAGLLGPIDWPVRSFRWRNRDTRGRQAISPSRLREILKACERDIAQLRLMRERGRQLREAAHATGDTYMVSPGAVLAFIDDEFGGVLPPTPIIYRTHNHFNRYLIKHGGVDAIEPYLYLNAYGLFPYYLAMVLHTAGNSQAVADMSMDCLQPIPLLDDRELLVWDKPRSSWVQRRSFRISDPFEPPTLVREIIQWTQPLRTRVPKAHRDRLFLMKTSFGPTVATRIKFERPLRQFIATHKLSPFSLGTLRSSALTALYRSTGDLRAVKAMANHVSISTTARYVQGPEVAAQNSVRMAALQSAWLGHVEIRTEGIRRPKLLPPPWRRRPGRPSRCSDSRARIRFRGWRPAHAAASSAPTFLRASLVRMRLFRQMRRLSRACFTRAITCRVPPRISIRLVGRPSTARS